MKFTKTEPDENFSIVRLVSENNAWEVGIRNLAFDLRVSANPVGYCCYTLDYCAGNNRVVALVLLATVIKILEPLPENITAAEVERLFPVCTIEPLDRDEDCWQRLQEMAEPGLMKS